jgi:cell division protein FtsB
VKRYIKPFRNKYILAFSLFFVYAVFLDDVDLFMIIGKHRKLMELNQQKIELSEKLSDMKSMQQVLENQYSLEKFAREERYFHKSDEDVFIIEFENHEQ